MSNPLIYPIPQSIITPVEQPILGSPGTILPPAQRFKYQINFLAGTTVGGTQPYGNNNNDGRFFRDPSNITATFVPNTTGLLVAQAAAGLRRTNKGHFDYMSGTNSVLWNRDLTNAVWVASGITATHNQVGADGASNAASLLTATANGGTIKQAFTIASNAFVMSLDIKRVTGTGTIQISLDGGTTIKDITAGLSASYSQQYTAQSSLTNPTVTIIMGTSGDQITVDLVQMCVPTVSGMTTPTQQRYATTSATVINSQSRPNAATADAGPLGAMAQGPFAFFWQGRSERPIPASGAGAYIATSDAGFFINVIAGGAMQLTFGTGVSATANNVWNVGLGSLNKVAGYLAPNGAMKVACNQQLGNATTGQTSPSLTHFDLGTNGSGANTLMGINETVAFGPNLSFSDADLITLTT